MEHPRQLEVVDVDRATGRARRRRSWGSSCRSGSPSRCASGFPPAAAAGIDQPRRIGSPPGSSRSPCSGRGCPRWSGRSARRWAGVLPQERDRAHDHPGRAEPALDRARIDEGAHHGVERAIPVPSRPSMVSTSRPSRRAAGSRQEFIASPSTRIVQAPHSPSPQPSLGPGQAEGFAQELRRRPAPEGRSRRRCCRSE